MVRTRAHYHTLALSGILLLAVSALCSSTIRAGMVLSEQDSGFLLNPIDLDKDFELPEEGYPGFKPEEDPEYEALILQEEELYRPDEPLGN